MRRAPFAANIMVSNFPENFTSGELASLFDEYGLVLGAVITRPPGNPAAALRGMVNLAPPKAVERAITALDGTVLAAHHLRVRKAPEPPARKPKPRPRAPAPGRAPDGHHPPGGQAWSAFEPVAAPRPVRALIVERRPLARGRLAGLKPAGD